MNCDGATVRTPGEFFLSMLLDELPQVTAYATQCDEMFQVLRCFVCASSALGATTGKQQGSDNSGEGNSAEEQW